MKTKLFSIFISIAMMMVMLPPVTLAAEGDINLVLSNADLAPSQDFDVEIHIDTGGKNLSAFDLYLDFDASDITVNASAGEDGLTPGADAGNYTVLANPGDVANGHYKFAGICAENCANSLDAHIATIHMQTSAGFDSGTSNLSLRVNDLADELGTEITTGTLTGATITSNVVDETAPIRSNVQPSGELSDGTSETTISLSTDENATCRYSTTAGTAYASMTNDFTTTGSGSHSVVVTGLADGNNYNYYVRCMDENNNENTDDLTISFSVSATTVAPPSGGGGGGGGGSTTDTSAAVISNGTPSGTLSSDITEAVIAVNTNEVATCRYSTTANTTYSSMSGDFDLTGGISHSFSASGFIPGNTYTYYVRCQNSASLVTTDDYVVSFNIKSDEAGDSGTGSVVDDPGEGSGIDVGSAKNDAGTIVSDNFKATTLRIKEAGMYQKLKGKILLKVEDKGRAYYIHPQTEIGFYLGRPRDAFKVMREQGVGITDADLEKIPFGLDQLTGKDSDGDGLPDLFENAIGTDKNKVDTDGDGYNDKDELIAGYSPIGRDKLAVNESFAKKHLGKIFLQVEGAGEAWYIYQNKRYYLGRPDGAFEIMRHLSLGISNSDFDKFSTEE